MLKTFIQFPTFLFLAAASCFASALALVGPHQQNTQLTKRQKTNPATRSGELSARLNPGSGRRQNGAREEKEIGWEQAGEKLPHFGAEQM